MALLALKVPIKPKKIEWNATVIRCNCLQAGFHVGQPCPQGIVEDLGRVAYWHRNPLMRLWVLRVIPVALAVAAFALFVRGHGIEWSRDRWADLGRLLIRAGTRMSS